MGPPSVFARIVQASAMPPLLIHCLRPADAVAGDPSVVADRHGLGLQRAQVTAGIGLGRPVGEQQPLLGHATEPELSLVGRRPDHDRVGAEERCQHAGCHSQVDTRHRLADAVDVIGRAAHPAEFLGDEQQLDAELVAAHLVDGVHRTFVVTVEVEDAVLRKSAVGEVENCLQRLVQSVCVQTERHGGPPDRAALHGPPVTSVAAPVGLLM